MSNNERLFREKFIKHLQLIAPDVIPEALKDATGMEHWYYFNCLEETEKKPDFRLIYCPPGRANLKFALHQKISNREIIEKEIKHQIDLIKEPMMEFYLEPTTTDSFCVSIRVEAPFLLDTKHAESNATIDQALKDKSTEIELIIATLRQLRDWLIKNKPTLSKIRQEALSCQSKTKTDYRILNECIRRLLPSGEPLSDDKAAQIKEKYEYETGLIISIEEIATVVRLSYQQ